MGGSKKQTVGYKYFMGLHAVFTHGPVDTITRILFDKKLAWSGAASNEQILAISQEGLFGGEDIGAEGGVAGSVDFLPGSIEQAPNEYLQLALGADDIPAFRGVTSLVFRSFYFGTSKYIKPVSVRMTRTQLTTGGVAQWYSAKASIVNQDSLVTQAVQYLEIGSIWEYVELSNTTSVPSNLEDHYTSFSGWSGAFDDAPFGHFAVGVDPPNPISTNWTHQNALWLRTTIDLQRTLVNVAVSGRVENSVFVFWDGVYIGTSNATNADVGGTPAFSISVPQELCGGGEHVVALYCLDEAFDSGSNDNTYIHAIVTGEYVTSQIDMNPAHIIRECLINQAWGMGYQEADIDDESFTEAADVLYDEGFGLSLLWDRQMQIDSFVGEIIKHIDAALFVDRKTGLFTLKLIRGDYDVEALPLLDESNIDKLEGFSRPTFGELVNSVSVNFWDYITGTDSSITITDPALIQMQGAVVNTTLQYPGITNSELASRIGMRDLTTLSNPLVSCTIYSNSVAEDFKIGSVFLFSWEDYGIVEMPMRVTAIAYGDGVKNAVKMTCTQDVFKLPATSTITPPSTGWEDPNQPPEVIDIQFAEEMSYYELVQRQGQSDVDTRIASNSNIGLTAFAASRPQDEAINARVYTDSGSGFEEILTSLDFAPSALLTSSLDKEQTIVVLSDFIDKDVIEVGTYATLPDSDEKVYVEAFDTGTNELTMRRGCLDTVPQEHALGARIFFDDVYQATDSIEYVESDEVNVKLLTVTGAGQIDIASATAMSITLASRAVRPYPPANVQINGEYWPLAAEGDVALTWNTRNRLLQTAPDLVGWYDSSVTEEDGVTYTVRIYDETNTLIHTESGLTSPTYTYDAATEVTDGGPFVALRIEIASVRDGFESYQIFNHTVQRVSFRITEEENIRFTESAQFRISE